MKKWLLLLLVGGLIAFSWRHFRGHFPLPTGNLANAADLAPPPPKVLADPLHQIVARYQKLIVLIESEVPPAQKEVAELTGRLLFQESRQAVAQLSERLSADVVDHGRCIEKLSSVEELLDFIDAMPHEADRLAFRDLLAELNESLNSFCLESPVKQGLLAKLAVAEQQIGKAHDLYDRELAAVFDRFEHRGGSEREAWQSFVSSIKKEYSVAKILSEYQSKVQEILSAANSKARHDSALELWGTNLPPKSFVLSFDDGPHHRYTPQIAEILKRYQVKAAFFELGVQLGKIQAGKVSLSRAAALGKQLLSDGHVIGNHSYSHRFLPKLSDAELASEIESTNQLIEAATGQSPSLFRPPYGASNSRLLTAIESHHLRSVLWTIDSMDWADPIAKSIAHRVLTAARKQGRGIILLHDIHPQTIKALPLILDGLKQQGFAVLGWDGVDVVARSATRPVAVALPNMPLYRESWAVLVGIDNYRKWPKLHHAVNDAQALRQLLIDKFHFSSDHVVTLLNQDATRERILSSLSQLSTQPGGVQPGDRVLVYFAGHGATRRLPSGRDLGYLVPVDGDTSDLDAHSISMTHFQDISEAIPAKHVMFVMDSCFSGLALTRGLAQPSYLRELTSRNARELFTAGGADEPVSDSGPNGHSVFTWTLLQGLDGRADANSDGFVTGTELAAYVGPTVAAASHQTPAFGNLPGSSGGDLVFELPPDSEGLNARSQQLDDEAIALNAELDRVRAQVAAKEARNRQLRQALAEASVPPKTSAHFYLTRGDRAYRERRYADALQDYLSASRIDPQSALAANNAGFVYFKLGDYQKAVECLERSIVLAPRRAVAYANLGDAYLELKRNGEARNNYQKYLSLEPNSNLAASLRTKLAKLPQRM